MKYVIIKDGKVSNTVEADSIENALLNTVEGSIAIQSDAGGRGQSYIDGVFADIPPVAVPEPPALAAIKGVLSSEIATLNVKYPDLELTAEDTIFSAIPKLLAVEALKGEVVYLKMLYDTVQEAGK